MRAPLSVCLPAPTYAAVGLSPDSSSCSPCTRPTSPRAEGLPGLYCPWLQSAPGARFRNRGSRALGSRALGWTSGRAWGPQGPSRLLSPAPAPPALRAPAVHLRWGMSTSRAGGRAAALGLCLEPRGSLLLPPPALPEPGPCAACSPCPFVPKAGGGGRPTEPEAGHEP